LVEEKVKLLFLGAFTTLCSSDSPILLFQEESTP